MATSSKDPTPTASPVVPPSIAGTERPTSSPSTFGLQKLTSSPPAPKSLELEDNVLPSSLISRSRSPGRFGVRWSTAVNETPVGSPSAGWWGNKSIDGSFTPGQRPWRDPPKRKKTIPPEQTEGWDHTKLRVGKAAASVLGTTGDIAHEALTLFVGVADFVPVPGLAVAAKMLLNIWDTLQLVDSNRMACLRLTIRCADILLSVRQEIKDGGDSIGEELSGPIDTLEESFKSVLNFLQKQTRRPFLKRYLKRDEVLDQIGKCDASLTDALGLFGLSIQIRILRQVQDAERERQKDTKRILDSIQDTSSNRDSSPIPLIRTTVAPGDVLPRIREMHRMQNTHDAEKDLEDLDTLLRTALSGSSDVDIVNVLQIHREDIPEAIKTLQRALERVVEKQGMAESQEKVEKTGKLGKQKTVKRKGILTDSSSGSSGEEGVWDDTIHREFIESGIDALKRMSRGLDMALPSWTITRYEVDRDEKIGVGFFSDVYKGTWHGRTVAIKVLADCTPRELFRREIAIWKTLKHENVLELYGASSASGDPPWFFVSPYEKNGNLVQFLKHVAERRVSSLTDGGGGLMAATGSGSTLTIRGRTATVPSTKLRGAAGRSVSPGGRGVERDGDLFRFMLETAKGMEYLHANGVYHGDLKASNVLVNDNLRCVISDFGQSEMKSEVYRISRTPVPHGTLRWQAPELMSGSSQLSLTPQMDVYSYAILCVEIVGMGRLPWPLMDDEAVRHFVLVESARPQVPISPFNTPSLQDLLAVCWHINPDIRPTFVTIVREVKGMRKNFSPSMLGHGADRSGDVSPHSAVKISLEGELQTRFSPDMRPRPLSSVGTPSSLSMPLPAIPPGESTPLGDGSLAVPGVPPHSTATPPDPNSPPPEVETPHLETTVPHDRRATNSPEAVYYTPSSSRSSSLGTQESHEMEAAALEHLDLEIQGLESESPEEQPIGYGSPPPHDERASMMRDERRYRLLLDHSFHPSLTLPLWAPSHVELGAVGYLSKPSGFFVTLFNSLSPEEATVEAARGLPSLYGYGKVTTGNQRQDKRSVAQRGLDAMIGFLTFKSKGEGSISQNVARRHSVPLRAGHKVAYMCTETTMYHYIERLEVPKKWFKANVDTIMRIYGPSHDIQKEDLFVVIGTLDTPDYALFVSHNHPDGQAHFNVYSAPRVGQPWGVFTTDQEVAGGPSYREAGYALSVNSSKVSDTGNGPWDTVLIARLRFKPDAMEPTSL